MKILIVHNAYQQRGGEDVVAAAEAELLAAHGNEVIHYRRDNDELRGEGRFRRAVRGVNAIWSSASSSDVCQILLRERPDITHFHNTFPLISPSAYYACANAGVPVVQTLHNYRLICPGGTLLREGRACELCVNRELPWPGVVHGCYRGSRCATAVVAAMLSVHRTLGTWSKVNLYIALSESSRKKLIQGGLEPERVIVKPNFVHPDPSAKTELGEYALYVGRLVQEKGVRVLLAAWSQLRLSIPLIVAGRGPLQDQLFGEIDRHGLQSVAMRGEVPHGQVLELMHGARFLVFPSLGLEGFPVTIAEAFACGLPVIASRLGTMEEVVEHQRTGLHVEPNSPEDLARAVEWAWDHPTDVEEMGRQARREYERSYSASQNYKLLMEIYAKAMRS